MELEVHAMEQKHRKPPKPGWASRRMKPGTYKGLASPPTLLTMRQPLGEIHEELAQWQTLATRQERPLKGCLSRQPAWRASEPRGGGQPLGVSGLCPRVGRAVLEQTVTCTRTLEKTKRAKLFPGSITTPQKKSPSRVTPSREGLLRPVVALPLEGVNGVPRALSCLSCEAQRRSPRERWAQRQAGKERKKERAGERQADR